MSNVKTKLRQLFCRHRERLIEVVRRDQLDRDLDVLFRTHTCKRCGKIVELSDVVVPKPNF